VSLSTERGQSEAAKVQREQDADVQLKIIAAELRELEKKVKR